MKSFIHCVWTGASFPFRVRQFIKNWVPYLRSCFSEFEVIVWLTEDSLEAATKYLSSTPHAQIHRKNPTKYFSGLDLYFIEAKLNHSKFYIGLLEPLFAEYPPILKKVVDVLHANKYYTSVSNISRVLIVNRCGGIYSDVDYLHPNKDIVFPKTIDQVVNLFRRSSTINFYMPLTENPQDPDVENQCLILYPRMAGALDPVITIMIDEMESNFARIETAARMNKEFLKNSITQYLARSMFSSGKAKQLLEAYKKGNVDLYGKAVSKLYEGQLHGIRLDKTFPEFKEEGIVKMVDSEGTRHFHYSPISHCTFIIFGNYFEKHLTIPLEQFLLRFWHQFRMLFSQEEMHEQFKFYDEDDDISGMYTWANPGYGRLSNLEKSVHSIEKHYYPKSKGRIPLNLINTFICQIRSAAMSTRGPAGKLFSELFLTIQTLIINLSSGFYVNSSDIKLIFHDLLIAARDCDLLGKAVELLNKEKYHALRNIIDPEQRSITADDLESFIRT